MTAFSLARRMGWTVAVTLFVALFALRGGAQIPCAWTSVPVSGEASVRAMAVFDDGTGPALWLGGQFEDANGNFVDGLARYTGGTITPVGSGLDGPVHSLMVWDDGAGPALFVGGRFTTAGAVHLAGIGRFDGAAWQDLGGGMDNPLSCVYGSCSGQADVMAMAVMDDGTGEALYAGGSFHDAGGAFTNNIARWDGSSWSHLGLGCDNKVYSLAAFDSGAGPELYAGGVFWNAGGQSAGRIARWDGSSWSAVGTGLVAPFGVKALASHDDGSGEKLYAGGTTSAGGQSAVGVARWDGSAWSAVGSGLTTSGVESLFADYDGGLFAGGTFTGVGHLGAGSALRCARWNGSSWGTLSTPAIQPARSMAVFDDGNGKSLYTGGGFSTGVVPVWRRECLTSGAAFTGNVGMTTLGSTAPEDVLFCNQSMGGLDRYVVTGLGQSIQFGISTPSMHPGSAHFALFGMVGMASASDAFTLPFSLGSMAFTPCAANPTLEPVHFQLAASVPTGCSTFFPTPPTPWSSPSFPINFPVDLTLQAIVEESPGVLSVTNAVIVSVL